MVDLPGITRRAPLTPHGGQPQAIQYEQVDESGARTLIVVTKVDKFPEEACEKVTDAVNSGLECVCVRNRTTDSEGFEETCQMDALFLSDPHLSKLDKTMVGVPALVDRIIRIRRERVLKCLPKAISEIEKNLQLGRQDLEKIPPGVEDMSQALRFFTRLLS